MHTRMAVDIADLDTIRNQLQTSVKRQSKRTKLKMMIPTSRSSISLWPISACGSNIRMAESSRSTSSSASRRSRSCVGTSTHPNWWITTGKHWMYSTETSTRQRKQPSRSQSRRSREAAELPPLAILLPQRAWRHLTLFTASQDPPGQAERVGDLF